MTNTRRDLRLPEVYDRPLYLLVADTLRTAIQQGYYPAGGAIPGERRLAGQLKVTRDVVREAVAILAGEGLIVKGGGGAPTTVRATPKRKTVILPSSAVITARMPSPQERVKLGIDPGTAIPIIEVHTEDGAIALYAAHSTAIHASQAG